MNWLGQARACANETADRLRDRFTLPSGRVALSFKGVAYLALAGAAFVNMAINGMRLDVLSCAVSAIIAGGALAATLADALRGAEE